MSCDFPKRWPKAQTIIMVEFNIFSFSGRHSTCLLFFMEGKQKHTTSEAERTLTGGETPVRKLVDSSWSLICQVQAGPLPCPPTSTSTQLWSKKKATKLNYGLIYFA